MAVDGWDGQFVPTLAPWRTTLSLPLWIKFFITGIVVPIASFLSVPAFGLIPTIDSPWQSGEPAVYVSRLLTRPTLAFIAWLIRLRVSRIRRFTIRNLLLLMTGRAPAPRGRGTDRPGFSMGKSIGYRFAEKG